MVALAHCTPGDAACLDANGTHDFGKFSVYYPPLPLSGRSNFEATFASRQLMIFNGYCGVFTFDLTTGGWYDPGDPKMVSFTLGGPAPEAVRTPATRSGGDALASPAPAGTNDCQPSAK